MRFIFAVVVCPSFIGRQPALARNPRAEFRQSRVRCASFDKDAACGRLPEFRGKRSQSLPLGSHSPKSTE